MIQAFVDKFMAAEDGIKTDLRTAHPDNYLDLVHRLMIVLRDEDNKYTTPDPTRIHSIDDGDYQGTLVFIIAAQGYQPSVYWSILVGYGSCSGCDTFEAIREPYSKDTVNDTQVNEYWTLMLHMVQGMKEL